MTATEAVVLSSKGLRAHVLLRKRSLVPGRGRQRQLTWWIKVESYRQPSKREESTDSNGDNSEGLCTCIRFVDEENGWHLEKNLSGLHGQVQFPL